MSPFHNRKGVTLIEVMIVVAILGIILAVIGAALSGRNADGSSTQLNTMGCSATTPSADQQDVAATNRQMDHYQKSQPVPFLDYSLERDIYIQLYQARQENVATHTVWRSDYGLVEFDCPSIGYPIPFDTSITNPLKAEWKRYSGVSAAITEQAEPNGLVPSKNSIATWVRCVYDGETVPIYIESKVTTFPYPVVVDYTTNRVTPALNASPALTLTSQ